MAPPLVPEELVMDIATFPLTDPVVGAVQAALFSGTSRAQTFSLEAKVMGTTARVTTVGGTPDLPSLMIGMLHQFDRQWSRFLIDSEISSLNNHPGQAVPVSPETRELVEVMLEGHRVSGGAFDPTLLPSRIAEGYAASLVNPSNITHIPAGVRRRGSPGEIQVSGDSITLPAGTTLDSGGAGKGFAADLVAQWARAHGALGALVEVGGDLRVSGVSPRADQWRLSIEHPDDPSTRLSVIEISESGVATSTISKRRFVVEGRQTHHIIDPGTGRSSTSDVVQATVIAPRASEAEIAAKIAFVRGAQELFNFAGAKNFQAACVTKSRQWITTKGWPEADA